MSNKIKTKDLINPSDKSSTMQSSPHGQASDHSALPSFKNSQTEVPEDGGMMHFIFFLWGVGVLLPWNAVLCEFAYFDHEMPGYRPEFVYPFAVNGLLAFTQLLMVFVGYKFSNRIKVQFGFIIAALIMFVMPFASHNGSSATEKYWTCFAILFFFGFISGMVQGQVFGLGGAFPFKYMAAIMFGNGVSGITTNVLKAILQITMPDDDQMFTQSLIFFLLSGGILLVCALMFSVASNNEFFQHYAGLKDGAPALMEEDSEALLPEEKQGGLSFGEFWAQFKTNMSTAYPIILSMWGVFTITFVVFPGAFFGSKFYFLDNIAKKTSADNENAWYQLIIIIIFNVVDTIGRYTGGKFQFKKHGVVILGLTRLVFIVTTILIAINNLTGNFWDQDWVKVVNMALFAFTNGLTGTMCAILAPSQVKDDQKEQVGLLVSLFLGLGIMSGSVIAIGVGPFIDNHAKVHPDPTPAALFM